MFHIIMSNPNFQGFLKKAQNLGFQSEINLLQLGVPTINGNSLLS